MMPSLSPGPRASTASPTNFAQVLPGSPTESLQSFAAFAFRFKRYVVYISGTQLNILSSPKTLVQVVHFQQELVAVAAEDQTGKIVVASQKATWVLQPLAEGWSKVHWEKTLLLRREDAGDETHWLSWGNDGELLVAGSRALSLFSTLPSSRSASPAIPAADSDSLEERKALWSQSVASAVRQAAFSPTATLIASCGLFDRLVKIWRRLSFEVGLFDHTYLRHPGAVTHIQWRPLAENLEHRRGSGVSSRHDEESEVLYTIANDGVLRVWRASGTFESEILALHATVDLVAAIPQSPSMTIKGQSQPSKAPRSAVMLPADKFCAAINAAIGVSQNDKVNHSKELLKEMISKEPDVVVVFDGQGRMSAWGLQSVGHKRRTEDSAVSEPYHIAHAEGMSLRVPPDVPALCDSWFQDDQIHFLVQSFGEGGGIAWWQGNVETFFSTAAYAEDERLLQASAFNGHDQAILEVSSLDGQAVSRSATELTQWLVGPSGLMKPHQSYSMTSDVVAATLLHGGEHLLTISSGEISLWDQSGKRLAKEKLDVSKAGKFHVRPANGQAHEGLFIDDEARTMTRWTVVLPSAESIDAEVWPSLARYWLWSEPGYEDVRCAIPVAMPHEPSQSCVVSLDGAGVIKCLKFGDYAAGDEDFEPFARSETGVKDSADFAASEEFAVVASTDRKELVIVELTGGYMEHRMLTEQNVKHLACFTPRPRHNFLAIAYDSDIEILAQGRYEYRSSDVPAWLSVTRLSMTTIGLLLTGLSWLPDGSLCLTAGSSMFMTEPDIEYHQVDQQTRKIIDLGLEEKSRFHLPSFTSLLKDPLPHWHPSLLSQLVRHGHHGSAIAILKRLARTLKFWSAGEDLNPTLGQSPDQMLQNLEHDAWLDDDTANDLREQLEAKSLPRTAQAEQQRLKHIVEALVYLRDHVKGLDRDALRYLFEWKCQLLLANDKTYSPNGSSQINGVVPKDDFVPDMHWREICFAYHSTTQQALLDILIAYHDNKLTWAIVRNLGIMTWLTEREALEQVFEQVGQTAYRADSPPDPVNAAIYYLALRRKPTLLALWRIATWHKEQKTTMNFLKRDFSQPEARTAAKKNAYALMGKRRFHYAAAFFLLADDPASATSLLAGQCEDAAFAIAVTRLYCGDGSPELRKLLEDRIITDAKRDGNRWLLSWCHSVLRERGPAAEALVRPQEGIVRTWQQDDPTTLLLYKDLRTVPSEHEYAAVLRSARILRRMGLWLLALEVVSQWQFKHTPSQPPPSTNGFSNGTENAEPKSTLDDVPPPQSSEPPSLLDNFATTTDDKAAREAKAAELLAKLKAKKAGTAALEEDKKAAEKKKPEPTQFKEPDANSLLDSFGF